MSEIIAVTAVASAIALAIVLILAARKPDTFRVQRAAVNMDKMIGEDFETGLVNLKKLTEK